MWHVRFGNSIALWPLGISIAFKVDESSSDLFYELYFGCYDTETEYVWRKVDFSNKGLKFFFSEVGTYIIKPILSRIQQ